MKVRMKRWSQLWFGVAVLAQTAYAAEIELAIAPPEPGWLVYAELSPGPCGLPSGLRLEACPKQLMPEGIAEVGEQSLLIEIEPLLAAGNFEAVLARIGVNYPLELVLLEAGDIDGFRGTRMSTSGGGTLRPTPGAQGRRAPSMSLYTDRTVVPLAGGSGSPPGVGGPLSGSGTTRGNLGPGPDTISASVLYVVGHSYFSLQRYGPAEIAFKLVLDALPNHVRAHESLAMLYLRTERYPDARVHLEKLAELGRNTSHVHSARGYLEQKMQRYWFAADAFQKALVLAPEDRGAQRGLLLALTETREHAKAKALVEQLLSDEPDDRDLWLYRAQIALASDERAMALASLETALRLGDDSIENRRACFELHMESGNVARAVELLRGLQARELPFPLVDRALGWLADENEWNRFRELLSSVDRSALGGVEQSRMLTRRASLALRDGNARAASTALQEALALDPSNADALMALAQIHRADRDYGRADLLFKRAGDYAAVREAALVARADVAIDQDDFDGALTRLREVVAAAPAREDVRANVDVLEDLVLLRTER
jgi:tetratricopeptide (TPR) repeat protein